MRLIQKIWNKFKTQPDEWFFYGFLLTLPLSIRKVLAFYQINGQFNEYAGVYLYLSDVFLMLAGISWVFSILYNKSTGLSICKIVPSAYRTGRRGTIIIPLLLVVWSFISILWSENQSLATFRSIKLLEFFLLYIYISAKILFTLKCSTWNILGTTTRQNVTCPPREDKMFHVEHFGFWRGGAFLRNSLLVIIFTGTVSSAIGIWQFVVQHSSGLFWLKESLISSETPGVAKIIFDEERFIRAYGLFPHPNILGGFLLFSILCTWLYRKLFHPPNRRTSVEQLRTQNTQNCSICLPDRQAWNNRSSEIVPRGTFCSLILAIQIIALILTFSKSALWGLILSFAYIAYKIIPRGTKIILKLPKLFHVEHFYRKLILAIGIILILGLIAEADINSLLFKSLNERIIYLNVSRGTILDHSISGVGAGQFVSDMQKYTQNELEIWQFQPVHNIFLLIWSELGAVGLLIFILFLYKLFHVEQSAYKNCSTWNKYPSDAPKIVPSFQLADRRGTIQITETILKGVTLGYIFIMLFDHYLWDIQQGQLLLWLTLGLLNGAIVSKLLGYYGSIDK